ncbi:hypothetical protein WJU16_11605 [Chitinophaga pollutisoli]|uniref:Uncharacterized protein n=1 Tax=Chitinophaga pollutisoli TaxID=3133966 RepID=A0ABZ2YV94_9BACT
MMKKRTTTTTSEVPFDIYKWGANAKITIKPRSYFPDASNHPFFKRKLEAALERAKIPGYHDY